MKQQRLEILVQIFTQDPSDYFQQSQGSRARYRNFLEKHLAHRDVGKYLRKPHGDPWDCFLRHDIKKHYKGK